jgi:hypothetical protein
MGDLKRLSKSSGMDPWIYCKTTYGLNVITHFFGDELGNVLIEGVLDADLIAIYARASLADHSWLERYNCNRLGDVYLIGLFYGGFLIVKYYDL